LIDSENLFSRSVLPMFLAAWNKKDEYVFYYVDIKRITS
jgi:hypothetical protein